LISVKKSNIVGGQGSGEWLRWGAKETTSSRLSIDIRNLQRKGALHTGVSGHLSWIIVGGEKVAIQFCVETDQIVFEYTIPNHEGKELSYQNVVDFDYSPCNFGGKRIWFICPECETRVAIIYRSSQRFICRRCCGLVYTSQNESEVDRLMFKSKRIRAKLGGTGSLIDDFPPKPKGMHWRTYWRLLKEAMDAERPFWASMAKYFS